MKIESDQICTRTVNKRDKNAHGGKTMTQSPVPEYVLKPGVELSKISDNERLDITETDEDQDEGVGDGNIGQRNSDFENGLRDVQSS